MKRILSALILFAACIQAHAQYTPYAIRVQQRTIDAQGLLGREISPPADGKSGLFFYNSATMLPDFVTLGPGLSIMEGVLSATSTGAAQVNADWNATSGLARILNKPAFSTVAYSGQAGDLTGLAPLAFTGAWTDIIGKPAFFSGAYADLSGKPTLFSGNYNDLANKPTIPAAYAFNFGEPAARTLALSTAYQATDATKPAIITVSTSCTASLSVSTGGTCALQVRTSSTTGLSCSSGLVYATVTNANTGTLTVGLGLNQRVGAPTSIHLRTGGYFILCPVSGAFTVDSAADQSAG